MEVNVPLSSAREPAKGRRPRRGSVPGERVVSRFNTWAADAAAANGPQSDDDY